MSQFKSYTLDGNEYFILQIERNDETGEALLYQQLQERMEKIGRNIEKCGSLEKLEEMGGAATHKFLVNTKNMIKEFLLTYQVEQLLTSREDVQEAADNVNNFDVWALLSCSWDKILSIAEDMRNSLIDHLFARRCPAMDACVAA